MTKRGVLLIALIIAAVSWLSQRADKISTWEEEKAGIIFTPSTSPSSEGENDEAGGEGEVSASTSPQVRRGQPAFGGLGEVESAVSEIFLVASVIDGDTIKLANGQTVRYIGIDAPEVHHPKKSQQCFSQQATQKNRQLVEGKHVRLEKDVSDKDKYRRLLRYVYVDDMFINDILVREGYAHAYPWPPDVAHRDQLRQAQNGAKTGQKGLWGTCG